MKSLLLIILANFFVLSNVFSQTCSISYKTSDGKSATATPSDDGEIDLSKKNITEITSIKNCEWLKELNLSHNQITSLSDKTFNNLTHLHKLDLSHNKITSLLDNTFNNLTISFKFDLSHNQITNLPNNIFNSVSSIYLDLSYNKITSLPDKIFDSLTDLMLLDLSSNKITSLPDTIFSNLQKLLEVYIGAKESLTICVDTPSKFTSDTRIKKQYHDDDNDTYVSGNDVTVTFKKCNENEDNANTTPPTYLLDDILDNDNFSTPDTSYTGNVIVKIDDQTSATDADLMNLAKAYPNAKAIVIKDSNGNVIKVYTDDPKIEPQCHRRAPLWPLK